MKLVKLLATIFTAGLIFGTSVIIYGHTTFETKEVVNNLRADTKAAKLETNKDIGDIRSMVFGLYKSRGFEDVHKYEKKER